MRDIINCITKYIDLVDTESFIVHWKKFAHSLILGIHEGYQKGYYEPNIVGLIESIVNSIGSFETKYRDMEISTKSIFIHGNKSQVEFEYYDKKTQRELGDIIFILSIVYKGRKYFEKMTINQVKKSNRADWNLSSDSAKEQLYLLSRFPKFRGVNKSLIPIKEYNLPNYSGCLGSYGLLYYPGDFVFASSNMLDIILKNKTRLKLEDLLLYGGKEYYLNLRSRMFPWDICECPECLYILRELYHFLKDYRYPKFYPLMCWSPVLGNSCMAYNSYEFSDKYLRGCIGEMIYAKNLRYNHYAFQFLRDILSMIEKKARKENLENILKFVLSLNFNNYVGSQDDKGYDQFNYEGGGIGIIHTAIYLGEDK